MAGANLLALFDDIATLLDDVAAMSKAAAQKTAGVLGDDLAVNAEQASGVSPDRELPVVWAVFKGSMINKAILVPAAMLISAFIPWAITPILMLGGAYLCFEGSEKIVHFFVRDDEHKSNLRNALADPKVDIVAFEKNKISGAIRTDFILSAEIIALTLGIVAQSPLSVQVMVLSTIAISVTVGVYGIVAGIVKLDDLGLYLSHKQAPLKQLGHALVSAAPKLMKFLSIAGTAAMFFVGGGILVHGIPDLAHVVESLAHSYHGLSMLINHGIPAVFGLLVGVLLVGVISVFEKFKPRK